MTTNRTLANKHLKHYAFVPAIIWSAVLAFLMLLPADKIPQSQLLTLDKINHLIAYGLLSFLIALGYSIKPSIKKKRNALLRDVSLAMAYGTLLELLQYFVPGRALDLFDLLANLTGCLLGILIFNIFQKNKFVRSKLID